MLVEALSLGEEQDQVAKWGGGDPGSVTQGLPRLAWPGVSFCHFLVVGAAYPLLVCKSEMVTVLP